MPTKVEKDSVTGTMTTGHEWDGIKELNTPLPKWWVIITWITVAWSAVYCVLYPSWPSLSSYTGGTLGYSQREEVARALQAAQAQHAPMVQRVTAASIEDVRRNPELLGYAMAAGRIAFANNCAGCHGAGGQGARGGFPSLADDDWLWGGKLADIQQTISVGVRTGADEARTSQMPRFGADGVLEPQQINDVAEYVLSLSNRAGDAAAAQRGQTVYADNCVSCHGERGEGNREFGGPRLSDNIWLWGGDKASVVASIANARAGVMPAWTGRLDEATIKMLAVFVHALGGGEQ
ncbi:MAG: cytochrome-c oxidase, cbb3-type subunit III [Alphaproteobacteria bacterium]|nr:cytochrome-c oxidase, cbb3-type subunit III [Alphaproteobacteria bacterium]